MVDGLVLHGAVGLAVRRLWLVQWVGSDGYNATALRRFRYSHARLPRFQCAVTSSPDGDGNN